MSSYYLRLSCPTCVEVGNVYVGDVETPDEFDDTWKGETIQVLCRNCQEKTRTHHSTLVES